MTLGVVLACSGGLGSPEEPAQAFDNPPAWPGYQWSYRGEKVGGPVITTAAGPEHCGSQSATLMTLGWPPGTPSPTAAGARQYVRDPRQALPSRYLKGQLDLHAHLPAGAVATGLGLGALSIYLGPDGGDSAVFVTGRHSVERWPRSDPMTLCA